MNKPESAVTGADYQRAFFVPAIGALLAVAGVWASGGEILRVQRIRRTTPEGMGLES